MNIEDLTPEQQTLFRSEIGALKSEALAVTTLLQGTEAVPTKIGAQFLSAQVMREKIVTLADVVGGVIVWPADVYSLVLPSGVINGPVFLDLLSDIKVGAKFHNHSTELVTLRNDTESVITTLDGGALEVTESNNPSFHFRKIDNGLLRNFASDAAADADTTLLSGGFYRVAGGRAVYQKP